MQTFIPIQASEIKLQLNTEPKQDVWKIASKVQRPLLEKGWEVCTGWKVGGRVGKCHPLDLIQLLESLNHKNDEYYIGPQRLACQQ